MAIFSDMCRSPDIFLTLLNVFYSGFTLLAVVSSDVRQSCTSSAQAGLQPGEAMKKLRTVIYLFY